MTQFTSVIIYTCSWEIALCAVEKEYIEKSKMYKLPMLHILTKWLTNDFFYSTVYM